MKNLIVMRRCIVPVDTMGNEVDDYSTYQYVTPDAGSSTSLEDAEVWTVGPNTPRSVIARGEVFYPVSLRQAIQDDRSQQFQLAEAHGTIKYNE